MQSKGKSEMRGSLRYATNDEAVRRFGRDDVSFIEMRMRLYFGPDDDFVSARIDCHKIRHLDRSIAALSRCGVERPPHFAFSALSFLMPEIAYVYIMSSSFQRLYIGVTSEIEVRVAQHKNGAYEDSFTSKYRIDKLVYFERFGSIVDAIAREKQLKRWSRVKKIRLIVAENPTWRDLSVEWGKMMELYSGE